MYCSKCGAQNPDQARFCQKCGNTLSPVTADDNSQGYANPQGYTNSQGYANPQGYTNSQGYANPQGYTNSQGYANPQGYTNSQGYANPQGYTNNQSTYAYSGANRDAGRMNIYEGREEAASAAVIRNIAGSTLFLVAISIFSGLILVNIIASVQGSNGLISTLLRLMNQYYYEIMMYTDVDPGQLMSLLSMAKGTSVISAVMSQLIPILIAVSLWLIFAASKKMVMNTTGITIIKVWEIISFVFSCIGFALFTIGFIFATILAFDNDAGIIMIFFDLIFALIAILSLMYQLKLIGCLTAAKKAVEGDNTGVFSRFVIVMLFISGVLGGIIQSVSSIVSLNIIGLMASILSATVTIMFGIILGKARSAMKLAENGAIGMPSQPSFPNSSSGAWSAENGIYSSTNTYTDQGNRNKYTSDDYGIQNQNMYASDNQGIQNQTFSGEPYPNYSGMNMDEPTRLLSSEEEMEKEAIAPRVCYLQKTDSGETVTIDRYPFTIGKSSNMNLCLSQNPTISRNHASILEQDGKLYVMDNNSLNHTFVNGEQIIPEILIPISDGCRIRFSNDEYLFIMN